MFTIHTITHRCTQALAVAVLAVFLTAAPSAGQFTEVTPEAVGLSSDRLERLESVIQDYVDRGKIAGTIDLVLRDGKAAHLESYGMIDRETGREMPTDAIFRIASMSKAVTTVAVMILYEEGHFRLSDPVHEFLPEFEDPVVALETSGGDEDGYETVPAERPITIHHLLTHTSGLTYGSGPASAAYEDTGLTGWYLAGKDMRIGEVVEQLANLPLNAQPGEEWQYGYSTDVLGHLVEEVSGMPLDEFFQERIFDPLGMTDTHFFLPPEKSSRLAPVYGLSEDGTLELTEATDETDYIHGPRKCFSGGGGLLSTTQDYGRLLQMLLNGGTLDDHRILSPKSVDLMRSNNTGNMYPWDDTGFGLGFWVVEDLGEYGEIGSVGAYGWGSAYYPIYWVDPNEELVGLIMTQLRPARDLPLSSRFQTLVYQSIVESRTK
jgi:CubicO group peptidase (beta-lactamase class C family)